MCVFFFVFSFFFFLFFFFQAEDGIRDLVRSRGLGDVYKRQGYWWSVVQPLAATLPLIFVGRQFDFGGGTESVPYEVYAFVGCLLYTSDAADERSSVDLGGRRIIKKKRERKVDEVRVEIRKTT